MLTESDRDFICEHAYIPEHMADYVIAISQAEPFLYMDHLIYLKEGTLIFNGYPLKQPFDAEKLSELLELSVKEYHPKVISLLAPSIPSWRKPSQKAARDAYYRLDIQNLHLRGKLRNLIARAARDLFCERGRALQEEHIHLIRELSERRDIDDASRFIFQRVPDYVSQASSAIVWNARDDKGRLVAFTVAEYGAKNYGFYMFAFRARNTHIPGASDLLLNIAIHEAVQEKKPYMNLGLGINKGVSFFKEKWGATPFLSYETCTYRFRRPLLFQTLGM